MKTVFLDYIEPFLDAVSQQMDLYVAEADTGSTRFVKHSLEHPATLALHPIRADMSPKEFVFPLREIAAVFPQPADPEAIQPYAVFGLKPCDLRALDILDRVFTEVAFEDPLYVARRQQMLVLSSDCTDPAASCFCNVMHGAPFAEEGYDLNFSVVKQGILVEIGSERGQALIANLSRLIHEVPHDALAQREAQRQAVRTHLEDQNRHLQFDGHLAERMEHAQDDPVFNEQAQTCVECQACTRVCPTCHCFYLYDRKQQDYFSKLKMWDSCMRFSYARVAGGGNPRISLGDRLRHRLLHKFAYFTQRYDVDMCVGCGRCVDAEAGAVDIRVVLQRINEAFDKQKTASA